MHQQVQAYRAITPCAEYAPTPRVQTDSNPQDYVLESTEEGPEDNAHKGAEDNTEGTEDNDNENKGEDNAQRNF